MKIVIYYVWLISFLTLLFVILIKQGELDQARDEVKFYKHAAEVWKQEAERTYEALSQSIKK